MPTRINTASVPQLRVISFGFGHGSAPPADVVLDVRQWFRDPHVSLELRSMTGRDQAVIDNVLSTVGVLSFVDRVFAVAGELVRIGHGTVTVAVGCVGGRHRSTVIADQLNLRARAAGWSTEIVHRDVERPVLTSRRTIAAGSDDQTAVGQGCSFG